MWCSVFQTADCGIQSYLLSRLVEADGLRVIAPSIRTTVSSDVDGRPEHLASATLSVLLNLFTNLFMVFLFGPGFRNLRLKSSWTHWHVHPRNLPQTAAIHSSMDRILSDYLKTKIKQEDPLKS